MTSARISPLSRHPEFTAVNEGPPYHSAARNSYGPSDSVDPSRCYPGDIAILWAQGDGIASVVKSATKY